jgi:biopolymer transport protein ExbD
MAFAGSVRSQQEVAAINITPLVDVLLVLLIIFMVAAPLLSRTLALDLQGAPPDEIPPPPLALVIDAQNAMSLDGVPVAGWLLPNALRAAHGEAPGRGLAVTVSPEASYQPVAQALAAARNAGIAGIAVETP